MNKKWGLIPKILTGEKSIESRWYVSKIAPWNRIIAGDTVYFKDSGEAVTAVATVTKVIQVEALDRGKVERILRTYGKAIALSEFGYSDYYMKKRYCILIFLANAKPIHEPFKINKNGFGSACAWMTVQDISSIRQ